MVVDRLYYNAGEAPEVATSINLSGEVLMRALENIYSRRSRSMSAPERNLFDAVSRRINEGISKGVEMAAAAPGSDFVKALRHSADVFSAFKVHRAQSDMARLLLDSDGNLKPFEQWLKDVMPIASHQMGPWLRTEYNTAVIRAHQAADWQRFLRERDILPNLEWIPSTSVTPGLDHRPFWGVVRPVEDTFWTDHRPGDRWNCKCSLRATDSPATAVPDNASGNDAPQPGLSSNPGTSGEIFSDDHPYFPADCASCPFYRKSVRNRLKSIFKNRAKDCFNCPYINGCIDRPIAKRPIIEAADKVKAKVEEKNLMPKFDNTALENLVSGMLRRTRKIMGTLLNHCRHDYDVVAAVYIWNHPEMLRFIRVSVLGEGKDMSTPKAQANIRKKIVKLGFLQFHVYEFDFRKRTFEVKMALCKKGYEQFYSLNEK